mmetsp:Transcript_32067/g.46216  ORF Transcript_32067/g.46216 Transcript_32067/m.46216 type:complete len:90 (-) Transcript_32067:84-353(-)
MRLSLLFNMEIFLRDLNGDIGLYVDLIIIFLVFRDDIKKMKVSKKVLLKFGVEGVHYFNFTSTHPEDHKEINEKPVVDYFKRMCVYLNE